jgi:hypothetical protein
VLSWSTCNTICVVKQKLIVVTIIITAGATIISVKAIATSNCICLMCCYLSCQPNDDSLTCFFIYLFAYICPAR